MPRRHNRVVFITTVPMTLAAILPKHIDRLLADGFDVHAVSSPGGEVPWDSGRPGLQMHGVPMKRGISPAADLCSVIRLWRLMRRLAPVLVQTHTPKAGLLGMIAARLTGVPIRIYTINGLRSQTLTGWRRLVVSITDRFSCFLASDVFCVSHSLRHVVVASGICSEPKVRTLGHGGSHGVDLRRFDPDAHGIPERLATRRRYGIEGDALVLGYVGRIVKDKGILELALAWDWLRQAFPNLSLLLCGVPEREDPLPEWAAARLRTDPKVHFTGEMVRDMPALYSAMDVCILPSYREGLPNVALEAAAMRIPIVATRIPGCVDAVAHGVTGLLVETRDTKALAEAVAVLLERPDLRRQMGAAARDYVAARFNQQDVSDLLAAEYHRLLKAHGYAPAAVAQCAGR